MKQFKLCAGIFFLLLSATLTFLTLFFPENALFMFLWGIGIFTMRGVASIVVIHLTSCLSALFGVILIIKTQKA